MLKVSCASLQQDSAKGTHVPNGATLQTNSSLKLGRWMHAYGELLRYNYSTLTHHPSSLGLSLMPAGPSRDILESPAKRTKATCFKCQTYGETCDQSKAVKLVLVLKQACAVAPFHGASVSSQHTNACHTLYPTCVHRQTLVR